MKRGAKRVLIIRLHFRRSRRQRYPAHAQVLHLSARARWSPLVLTMGHAYPAEPIPISSARSRTTSSSNALSGSIPRGSCRWQVSALDGAAGPRWISWWPAAVWFGMRMIRQYRPAALMSTFPIATAHRIALSLQQRSELPWIAGTRGYVARQATSGMTGKVRVKQTTSSSGV